MGLVVPALSGYQERKSLDSDKASGLRMAFLSNPTAATLDQAVQNSGHEGHSPRLNGDGTGPISFGAG
jgi:hypothetical protein